jgi:nicotinamidase-related amidase
MFTALSQLPGLLPRFETRRALVIINLQNDSLYSDGDMYITKNHEFVDRIKVVVPHFRAIGDIVWVQTEMGTKSSPISPGSAHIEEEVAKIDEKNREERKAEEQQLEDDTADCSAEDSRPKVQSQGARAATDFPTYHPSSRSKAMMMRASAKSRAERRTANMDVFNDNNDVFEEHMSKPRKGQQPRFYIGGTPGAEIADQLRSVVDESKDLFVVKHHYSAFDQTSLLMSLRMRLVTDVYLCGCLTNVGVYATAADAVQHGLVVTVVEDCLGYRSEAKHEDAMRQMADIMGVNGIDSEEIIEEVGGKAPPDAADPIFSGPGPEGIDMNHLSITQATPEPQPARLMQAPADTHDGEAEGPRRITEESEDLIKAEPRPRARPPISIETSNQPEPGSVEKKETQSTRKPKASSDVITPLPSPGVSSSRKRDSWLSAGTCTVGPQDSVGAGDSRIIHDLLDSPLVDNVFQLLREEVGWQDMYHRSGKVPRLVAVQGDILPDGSIPVYRHPADESPRLLSFSPTVQKIRREIERVLKQPFNHALIQLYRDGSDNISEHSDKVGTP